jgi:hypothetical protein
MPLLISDYFMQMAERVYGDAAATERSRGAATLARWIFGKRPKELHVRRLQREEQLPGLGWPRQSSTNFPVYSQLAGNLELHGPT